MTKEGKETKVCPYCGEEILKKAVKCRYCGEFLEDEDKVEEIVNNKIKKTEKVEKKPLSRNEKIFYQFLIFIGGAIFSTILSSLSRIFIIITILFCFWYAICSGDDKLLFDYKSYINPERYKNKKRLITAGILSFIFGGLSILVCVSSYMVEKEEADRKAEIASTPVPTIEILSQEGNIGDSNTYKFEANLSGATEVTINGENIELINGKISKTFKLDNPKIEIVVLAKNKHKSAEKKYQIERNLTEEEIEAERIAKEEAEKKAKEEAEKKEQERVQNNINDMQASIDYMPQMDLTKYIDCVSAFRRMAAKYRAHKDDPNANVRKKAEELKKKLIAKQKSAFPTLRKNYCDTANKLVWIEDGKVKCSGTTITFIHHSYALNKNVSKSHNEFVSTLEELRFKRANYRWIDSSYGEYTYYTIESPSDGDI